MKNKIKKKLEEEKQQNKLIKEKENKIKNQERETEDYNKNFDFFDKFPNENLFKNAQYGLNEILQFEKEEDKNRYISLILKISYSNKVTLLFFQYSRFIFISIKSFYLNRNKICLISLYIHIISILISFIILRRNNEGYLIWIVKFIFDINQSAFIYNASIFNFSISPMSELIYNAFSSFILNIQMKDIFYSAGIISITFLYNYKSLISNIITIIFGNLSSIIFIYLIKRASKYLWILYDSFKKSFRVVNNLLEYNFYPIFIISKNMDILYCNDAAKNFCYFIIKDKNYDSHRKMNLKMEINFQKLIIPSLYNLFNELLEDSINSEKKEGKFYFPFTTLNENINNLEYKKYTNLFLISEEYMKLNWYSVICQSCIWKVHKSIFINLIPSDEFIYNNILNNQNKFLLGKFEEYIDNSNKMCEIILRCERNSIIPYSSSGKNYKRLGIYIKKEEKVESVLSAINDNNFVFPNMDFTILFFFKNESAILFDLLLTQNIYLSLLNPRTDFECYSKKEVNLEFFTNYFSFYFDSLLTSKNYSLEFKIKENCKYIIIQDILLRITIFNILLFILSNSCYNDKKNGIVISIRLSREKNYQNKSFNLEHYVVTDFLKKRKNSVKDRKLTKKGIFSLEFDISITGDNLLDYNKINKILKSKNDNSFLRLEVEKQNLNIGILTVYYIITKYYKKEFTMNSNEKGNIILFKLTCEKIMNSINGEDNNEESYSLFQEKLYFYNMYYHEKLIQNIYNFDINNNNLKLNIIIEKHLNSNSLGKSSDFDSENDNNNKILNSDSFKKGFSLNNKSVNKVKTELKHAEKEFLNKNNQFDSFGIIKYKNE
jgi:hypothetical protein